MTTHRKRLIKNGTLYVLAIFLLVRYSNLQTCLGVFLYVWANNMQVNNWIKQGGLAEEGKRPND